MSFFNRQLYKQKPQAWGPVSAVQASIFRNAERIGIPAPKAAFPLFEGSGYPRNYMSGEVGTLYGSTAPLWTIGPQGMELVWQANNTGFMFSTGIKGMTYGSNDKWSAFAIARSPGTSASPVLSPGQTTNSYWHGLDVRYGISNNPLAMFEVDGYATATTSSVNNNLFYNINIGGANYTNTLRKCWAGINGAVAVKENTSTATNRALINRLGLGIYADASPTGFTPIINIAFFWPTWAMNDSVFYFLNDNPYFLLHRVPPVFYSVPGGAITIKTVTDTGTGLDGIAQISNILSVSDSGSGLDTFAGLAAGISVVDVGSGTDAVQPAASVTVQDTGVAIELIQQISAACSVADTGTGADNIVRLLASLFVSDTGSGSDIITVLKELLKTVTDSGTGTDSVSQLLATVYVGDTGSCTDTISQILADISVSDTGAGADFINLLKDILKTISDTGTGTDFVSIQPVSVSVYDAGMALDLIGHIAVALSVSDAGTVAEIISTIKTKLVTVTDTGTGSDSSPTISVSLTVSDVSAALDVVGQVLNSLTVSDTGSGLDMITKTDFNILPSGKVTVTFTIKTPGASFAMRTPKANFNIE